MNHYYWHPNALLIPVGGGAVRIFQPDARRNILVSIGILPLADAMIESGMPHQKLEMYYTRHEAELSIANVTDFVLNKQAHKNSAMCGDLEEAKKCMSVLSFADFMDLMLESAIFSEIWPPVDDFSKRGFADRFRGSFNEQVATEALLARQVPEQWWVGQKFLPGEQELGHNPYRYIEERFLMDYFAHELPGMDVLEVGCGVGYWARRMAQFARHVVGMDYNEEYLAIAKRNSGMHQEINLDFRHGDIVDLAVGGGYFQDKRFDFVFMIDVFLFLFDPKFQPHLHEHRQTALKNLKSLLKPNGRMVIMDPHIFWLTPWAGLESKPIAFMTEYRNRRFKEIATIHEYSAMFYDAGLYINRILEPDVDIAFHDMDPAGYAFMKEFPQWWVWELAHNRQSQGNPS